jgi:hypothetical protein
MNTIPSAVDRIADGWFRFTMTVTHPFFGEMFYQTGRFRAAGEQS